MRALVLVASFVSILVAGCSRQASQEPAATAWARPPGAPENEWPPINRINCPVVQAPPLQDAAEATLADSEKVVGVVVEGKARAYSLSAMANIRYHVLNDLIERIPLTVTYCNRKRCVRAYRGNFPGRALRLGVAGYREGLLLKDGDELFEQDSGAALTSEHTLPYAQVEYEVTNWSDWKKAHPETQVFVGDDPEHPQ
jgi:Protein of unknown function (DUF3179)